MCPALRCGTVTAAQMVSAKQALNTPSACPSKGVDGGSSAAMTAIGQRATAKLCAA
jgi:hypothetical protein